MRFAIMGSGGLGCLFGGVLARADADVTLIARGANLAALRARGLTVTLLGNDPFHVEVRATDNPGEVGPVDAVVLCVKTYDIDVATQQARPLLGPETLILPVQNGVEAAQHIAAIVGADHVVPGVGVSAATSVEPGVVVQKSLNVEMVFGPDRLTGGRRSERVRDALRAANIRATVSPHIERDLWEKFIFTLVGLGFMSLTRLPIGPTLACPETAEVARGLMAEGIAVGRARGVPLTDDANERTFGWMERIAAANPGSHGSMYFDLLAGKRLELEAINGAVVRMGRELGIPTPLNQVVYGALKPYADGAPAPMSS
jgi:2-dehydropantoate 2-reductase